MVLVSITVSIWKIHFHGIKSGCRALLKTEHIWSALIASCVSLKMRVCLSLSTISKLWTIGIGSRLPRFHSNCCQCFSRSQTAAACIPWWQRTTPSSAASSTCCTATATRSPSSTSTSAGQVHGGTVMMIYTCIYSAVTPCFCSMLGALRKWRTNGREKLESTVFIILLHSGK